jgi:hypothetical protein
MTEISAFLRLYVNPFLCHFRESGGSWPYLFEKVVHAETQRRGGITLRTLRPLREIFGFTQSAQRSQRMMKCAARRSRFLRVSASPREQILSGGENL